MNPTTAIILVIVIAILGAALVAAIGLCGLAVIAARRLVLPRARPAIRVIRCDGASLTVPANRQTLHPGTFGVWTQDGNTHTVVGEILEHDSKTRTVRRRIVSSGTRPLRPGEAVLWTSHVIPGPAALSPQCEDLELRSDGHALPAWLIPTPASTTRWAIHIHGIRTTRVTALRSVPAAQRAGHTSLVVSFRGDGEADNAPAAPCMLGATEWQDLVPAVRYARDHAATDITLIAWSMGAEAALNYLRHADPDQLVRRLVLIAPVTDWHAVLANGLRRAHLPTLPARLAARLLAAPRLHRLAGIGAPVQLAALDWTRTRLDIPTLIIHSRDDTEVPIDASRRLARNNPEAVTLIDWARADHALEYNTDAGRFTTTLSAWLGEGSASERGTG